MEEYTQKETDDKEGSVQKKKKWSWTKIRKVDKSKKKPSYFRNSLDCHNLFHYDHVTVHNSGKN
jgi:hypothetical protein